MNIYEAGKSYTLNGEAGGFCRSGHLDQSALRGICRLITKRRVLPSVSWCWLASRSAELADFVKTTEARWSQGRARHPEIMCIRWFALISVFFHFNWPWRVQLTIHTELYFETGIAFPCRCYDRGSQLEHIWFYALTHSSITAFLG